MPKLSLCFLLFFTLMLLCASAQKKNILQKSNKQFTLRSFDNDALNNYKADKDFHYGETRQDFSPSLWDRFWTWFWSLFDGAISNANKGGLFKYVFIGLGCAALLFLLVKLSGMDAAHLFTGRSKEIALPYHQNQENIHEISFDEAVQNALQNHDYRLAIRMLYLKSLKHLSDTGRITWQPEKTNTAYIQELKNLSQKEKFKFLTQRFEYVWYGSFPVDGEAYAKISHYFKDFNSIR